MAVRGAAIRIALTVQKLSLGCRPIVPARRLPFANPRPPSRPSLLQPLLTPTVFVLKRGLDGSLLMPRVLESVNEAARLFAGEPGAFESRGSPGTIVQGSSRSADISASAPCRGCTFFRTANGTFEADPAN